MLIENDCQNLSDKCLIKRNNFQEKYRAENVKAMVRNGSVQPEDLAKYLCLF